MKEFSIHIRSFREIQEFVSIATVQPFKVMAGNERQLVNAKSFIGMVSLDCSRPLQVLCEGDSDGVRNFMQQACRFLAK